MGYVTGTCVKPKSTDIDTWEVNNAKMIFGLTILSSIQ